ncbi:MAG: hypothetical protein DI542_10005, partial [Acinetobacter johnsonii]
MADIISLQELADAKLDAQSLEQFINGDVDEEVLTRLSQQYPTIKKLIRDYQKYNGRAYKTYAEMDADKANLSSKTKVTVTNDETASNNGDWQWDGAVFTKSAYDPVNLTKNVIDISSFKVSQLNENNISLVDFRPASGFAWAVNSFNTLIFCSAVKNAAVNFLSIPSWYISNFDYLRVRVL